MLIPSDGYKENLKQLFAMQAFDLEPDLKLALAEVICDLKSGGGQEFSPSHADKINRTVLELNRTVTGVEKRALFDLARDAEVELQFYLDKKRGSENIAVVVRSDKS